MEEKPDWDEFSELCRTVSEKYPLTTEEINEICREVRRELYKDEQRRKR